MLLLPVTLVCGQDLTRLWTSNLGSEFRWLSLATDGTPIAGSLMHRGDTATYMRVSGIDADTGEIKWNYEPDGDEMISGIKPISNSNFVQLNDAPLTILNVATGKPLVEIAKDGITAVYDYGFLPASGQLWIDADFGGAHNLFLYDLITGMNLWNNSELFNGASKTNQMVIKGVATMRAEDTEAPTLPTNQPGQR